MGEELDYYICYKQGCGELVEKKSRFIATVRPVHSEEEAQEMIAELKKTYWDANHNCSAYITGDRGQTQRCSDDGEPSQTAGRPMLDVLIKKNIRDICVVVTRYFGGTLLGTGGLVRAYQGAIIEGLNASTIVLKQRGYRLTYDLDYDLYPKIEYIVKQGGYTVFGSEFTDRVKYELMVHTEDREALTAKITETSAGRAILKECTELSYADVDGKVVVL